MTFSVNTESTYDWEGRKWSVPINFAVSQMLKVGKQPLTIQAGVCYWADSSVGMGPEGWGLRFGLTFLFLKN